MARQWNVECELIRCPPRLQCEPLLEHGVHQLVREGIANAVRHGKASRVSISLDAGETGVSLIVADNGSGFAVQESEGAADAARKPWSLNERVQEFGGNLALFSGPSGSRITISIPFGGR
jgi:signal transduction histidine kinase